MIKLLTQSTEYYCSTEEEAEEILNKRKEETIGKIIKHQTEVKENYTKLIVKEEYNLATDLAKWEDDEPNEYHELLDVDGEPFEYFE